MDRVDDTLGKVSLVLDHIAAQHASGQKHHDYPESSWGLILFLESARSDLLHVKTQSAKDR